MGKIKYIDLCAGIGGTRAGLDFAGWKCLHSSDIDKDAVAVHRLSHGDCEIADVTKMKPSELPQHDVLVAGFPCQPFSSSGYRSGFSHPSGSVFEGLLRLIEAKKPTYVILENVQGLLSNQFGYSFAQILLSLTSKGFNVEWNTINATDVGVPQNRPRLFIIAKRATKSDSSALRKNWIENSIFGPLMKEQGVTVLSSEEGDLVQLSKERDPQRKKKHTPTSPYTKAGFATGTSFTNIDLSAITKAKSISPLGDICSPKAKNKNQVRSVRYWAHTGKTEVYIKEDPISHCLGTSIGAPPIFCVPKKLVNNENERAKLMQFSNWSKENKTHFFFRLIPERAVHLFGSLTKAISEGLEKSKIPNTVKYKLIGNMVSPHVAFTIAKLVERDMSKRSSASRSIIKSSVPALEIEL